MTPGSAWLRPCFLAVAVDNFQLSTVNFQSNLNPAKTAKREEQGILAARSSFLPFDLCRLTES
jgi:hypothetical protein